MRYRRLSTERVLAAPFFAIDRHAIESMDVAEVRHDVFTFRFEDWVSVVAIDEAGRFVLVRQHRHGVDRATIETAGGIVDPGEDPEVAGLRELLEETGYAGEAAEPLGWVHPNPALQDNRCFLFMVRAARLVGATSCDRHEFTEPLTLPADEVVRAIADGRISHAISVLALERALGRRPGKEP